MTTITTSERGRLPVLTTNAGFQRRMAENWGVPDRAPRLAAGLAASTAGHRERLSAEWPGATLIVSAGGAMLRNDDEFFPFRADSDFLWLTGCPSPDAVLVMYPSGDGHDSVLYLREPIVAGDPDYLSGRERSELWMGGAPTLREWSEALAVEVRGLGGLAGDLGLARAGALYSAGRPTPASSLPMELHARGAAELGRSISELRVVKDDWEIAQLREAVDATVEGFEAVAGELRRANADGGERWLQGTFDRVARTRGNTTGYRTIVAAGEHAPVLHWTRNDGPIRDGDLLLLDAGVESRTFYTSDVTRTFPINGSFTAAQRQVHDLVQASHEAGMAAVRPGNTFTDFHHAAMAVIAQGLHDWDLLGVSVDEALSEAGQHHRRYLICGIGHHLGLDVHDCSKARHEHYNGAELAQGMALTVEPGLYFHAHDLSVPPELRGIGVRIEDDLVVTATGAENLSEALPRDATGLENWVRGLQ